MSTRRVRFQPKRADDLRPAIRGWVGREFTVHWAGVMDEGDYDGQTMWSPDWDDGPRVAWIPDCDLVDA